MEFLVVDNNISTAAALREATESWSHHFKLSETGQDALVRLRQKRYDLVLLNIFLADMKGEDLIPQFKEIDHAINIVAMTDCDSRELELEIRQKGIIYYMIKPVDTKVLKIILDHISKKKGGEKPWQN